MTIRSINTHFIVELQLTNTQNNGVELSYVDLFPCFLLTDSCEVHELFLNVVTSCFEFYSSNKEEKRAWIERDSLNRSSVLCPENWQHNADRQFGGFDSWGRFAVYSGGGYIANLGYNKFTAGRIIDDLIENDWIDRQTRAVLVEFSLYNPPSNLLAVMTYYFEVLPSGFAGTFKNYGVLPLSATNSQAHNTYLLFAFLFGLLLVCYFAFSCIKLCRQKCSYFKSVWNWLDMMQILTASSALFLQWMRTKVATQTFEKLKLNPFVPVSFHHVLLWFDVENLVICVASVIATLRLLKCFYFNPQIIVFSRTLRRSFTPIASFFVVFSIVAIAHALLGFISFGTNVDMFALVPRAIFSQFLMLLGHKIPVNELKDSNPILGRFFFITFVSSTTIIIGNMFIAIINEHYATSNADKGEDFELAEFIIDRIVETVFGQKSKRNRIWTVNENHELFEPEALPEESSSRGVPDGTSSPEWTPVMYRSCTHKVSKTGRSLVNNSGDFIECSVWETYRPEHLLVKSSTNETGFASVNLNNLSGYIADARRYNIITDWNEWSDYNEDDDGNDDDYTDDEEDDDDDENDDSTDGDADDDSHNSDSEDTDKKDLSDDQEKEFRKKLVRFALQ